MSLEGFLADQDQRWSADQKLVWMPAKSAGYHTRIADGTKVHSTRTNMDYAAALLISGDPARVRRAHDVIERIVSMQNTDPTHRHYGIWPWFAEEPPEKMQPADWNWADFIGARLAQILVEHGSKLTPDLTGAMREALGHAAWSIFRRNVQVGYTNIAIMGAGVTLAAGEVLGERRLVEYGRKRLNDMVRSVAAHGDFIEYNSPTYTRVALEELERILQLVHDPAARADAERLRRVAWRVIAEHFHPGTQQWAGPHSRAYSDHIGLPLAHYLSSATGVPITARASGPEPQGGETDFELVRPIPCPPDLTARFAALPQVPHVIQRTFIPRDPPAASDIGTTWFDADACLGSINHDILWHQRRALLGYWRTMDDPAVVLRLRCLKNQRDFAPGFVRQVQAGPRVLSTFGFILGGGDFHPIWDTPPDHVYRGITDLRFRFELSGRGVRAEQLDDRRFALAAGEHRAVIHAAAGTLDGQAIAWTITRQPDHACIDAVLHSGSERALALKTADLRAAAAVELLPIGDPPASQTVDLSIMDDEQFLATWGALEVRSPRRAVDR